MACSSLSSVAEELQLVRVAHRAVGLLCLDLGEQHLDRIRIAGHFAEAREPGRQFGILVREAVDRLLELDVPPDTQLVEVILRLGALEMVERRLGLAAVVQEIREIDPRLAELGIQLERTAQPVQRARVVAEPVGGVAEARGGVRGILMGRGGQIEEPVGGRRSALRGRARGRPAA